MVGYRGRWTLPSRIIRKKMRYIFSLRSSLCKHHEFVVVVVTNAVAAKAHPPLWRTSQGVCGVEGRRFKLSTLQYTPSPSVLQVLPVSCYVFYPPLVPAGSLVSKYPSDSLREVVL